MLSTLKNYKGTILKTSLTVDKEDALRAVLEGEDGG